MPKQQQSKDPGTSASLRTPIVVKKLPSYRSASRPHIQDASLVETHLSSKMRAVPQGEMVVITSAYTYSSNTMIVSFSLSCFLCVASLAKLQAESEKSASEKSLLSSLAKCEVSSLYHLRHYM